MPLELNKLTSKRIDKLATPGWYGDGGNLWLVITKTGVKSWVYRYKVSQKQKVLGLGPLHAVNLAEARVKARALRNMQADGRDPVAERQAQKLESDRTPTFKAACTAYIEAQKHGWSNSKHSAQWTSTLETYAVPIIGNMKISAVQTADIVRVLVPIWTTKTETASRVRQRMEKVLGWATTAGYRTGDNPARWKGHIENLLAKPADVAQRDNQPSLPWVRVPEFMQALQTRDGIAARALEFAIFTAARAGEVRFASWPEIDLEKRTWTVPAERMKAKKAHEVPLSDAVVDLLRKLPRIHGTNLVFPSGKQNKPLSDATMAAVIKRMNEGLEVDQRYVDPVNGREVVPHGFRSSFRVWAAEATNFPRDVAEHALAHQLPDKVEAAYQRSTVFPKRVKLMASWSDYATNAPTADNVISIAAK